MSKATDYDKKTPREHVLDRPDTYIGSIEKITENMDICRINDTNTYNITNETITYVPGFWKCFDELLVNACDAKENDTTCDTIQIEVNKEEGFIRIFNNGMKGIPVEEHPTHKIQVGSLIFGELLTSSNYDDTKKRTTGGRNGYGAKLANIFSTKFEVEIGDSTRGKLFTQTWKDNMNVAEKASVKKYTKKTSYVQVTFYPDFVRFGLTAIDDDHFNLFYRRAIDIAGISNNMKIHFNDKKINISNFKQYITAYYPENEIFYDDSNERWKVGCIYIPDSGNKIVSFVNAISTYNGGTHAVHVMDKILRPLIDDFIKKKDKDIKITPAILKDNLVFFINSMIESPAFSSQTKDTLTTKVNKFGSVYEPTDLFLKKIAKSGIIEQVIKFAKFKESVQLKKNDGKKQVTLHGIPKLEDANKAGGKDSYKCALILTEGDSAKAFAMSGLSIVGRDYYGVFPLKGKLLNAREAPIKQLMGNDEINNIIKIMGLKHGESYDTEEAINTLRYLKIICLTDQDVDGSHIKGLLINLFHHLWPNLIKKENFITSFATPIVKAFKGKESRTFYNLTEYGTWAETNIGWKIKYYKGLGTSTSEEAKEYFHDIDSKLIRYFWEAAEEGLRKGCDDALTLAFQKNRSDDRKEWLIGYNKNEILTYEERKVSYSNFIHKDMKHFSNYDNSRSIPHMMDGFKPSQRKIYYGAIKRKLMKTEVKVAQLAGFVSDKAGYHHGEMSLVGAIIGMAQNFVGSNNINLLEPNGQFGTRLMGGKDAAAGRYIWTKLTNTGMIIFNIKDYDILNHIEEDGVRIEPEFYAPIIPMILVNGAEGIGTGFSTNIPCFNPIDIIGNIYNIMDGNKFKEMKPYWRGFKGVIRKIDKKNFESHGLYSIKKNKLIITELPVGTWTQNYKDFLEKMYETEMAKPKEERVFIGFKEYHTDVLVHFELEFIPDYIETIEDINKTYHLVSKISLNNMHLYSVDGNITKYESAQIIMKEYYINRLELYEKRKQHTLDCMKNSLDIISNKVRFITMVIAGTILINNRKKDLIEKDLITHNFPKLMNNKTKIVEQDADIEDIDMDENTLAVVNNSASTYDYLLKMPIYQLTFEKLEKLKKQQIDEQHEYDVLHGISPVDIWKSELEVLKQSIDIEKL